MKVIVRYDGQVYTSKSYDGDVHEKAKDNFEKLSESDGFSMALDTDIEAYLIMGKEAVQKAVFIYASEEEGE